MKGKVRIIRRWGIVLGVFICLAVAGSIVWADFQRAQAIQAQALAHTRLYIEGQPEMSVQVYEVPGQPSIGAVAPFTTVSVHHCVVTSNDKQYVLVTVDPASVYFPGRDLYVRSENVEHTAGAPGC